MSVGVVPREFAVTVDVIDCDSGSIVNGIDCDSGSGVSADSSRVVVDGNDVDTACEFSIVVERFNCWDSGSACGGSVVGGSSDTLSLYRTSKTPLLSIYIGASISPTLFLF